MVDTIFAQLGRAKAEEILREAERRRLRRKVSRTRRALRPLEGR